MASRSLSFCVIIKPDGVRRGLIGEVIKRFEKRGFSIKNMKMVSPDETMVSEHYIEHHNKSYFASLMEFMMSGNIVVMEIVGDLNVAKMIVGESLLPHKSLPGSIRGDYTCSISHNLVHCSDTIEKGCREVNLWFNNSLDL